jgi:hypothetical protein
LNSSRKESGFMSTQVDKLRAPSPPQKTDFISSRALSSTLAPIECARMCTCLMPLSASSRRKAANILLVVAPEAPCPVAWK